MVTGMSQIRHWLVIFVFAAFLAVGSAAYGSTLLSLAGLDAGPAVHACTHGSSTGDC